MSLSHNIQVVPDNLFPSQTGHPSLSGIYLTVIGGHYSDFVDCLNCSGY
jgi:hypothetical protein